MAVKSTLLYILGMLWTVGPEVFAQSSKCSPPAPPGGIREGGWAIALMVLAALGILIVVIFEIYLMVNIARSGQWKSIWLGQTLLLGIFLCYLLCFAFVPVPTRSSCQLIQSSTGVVYAMCFSVLFVKLLVLLGSKEKELKISHDHDGPDVDVGNLKDFKSHDEATQYKLPGLFQVVLFLFSWGIQIVIDVEWVVLRPGHSKQNRSGDGNWYCVLMDDTSGDDPNCPGVMSDSWKTYFINHIISLVYIMLLIVICVLLALRCRRIAANFHEAVYIGLASGLCIPVWIVWILIGALSPGHSFHAPATGFGLWVTATVLLFAMFLPKVKQLNSMRKNTKKSIGKDHVDNAIVKNNNHVSADNVSIVYTVPQKQIYGDSVSLVLAKPEYRTRSRPHSVVNGAVVRSHDANNVTYVNHAFNPDDFKPRSASVIYEESPEKAESIIYEQHVESDPNALYVRHPGSLRDLRSIDRTPQPTLVRTTRPTSGAYSNTRLHYVHYNNRRPPSRPQSEVAYPVSSRPKHAYIHRNGSASRTSLHDISRV
ncbi:unnamed protein product [Owenia fusiformis]|uniref:Uncharacterized protein n=1 Tax=Owenia fusiformis TaxID=6347 RepID=A0A8J1TKQ5_OWEFU|nr:unnamed protein product [Owenia fusiformis]